MTKVIVVGGGPAGMTAAIGCLWRGNLRGSGHFVGAK